MKPTRWLTFILAAVAFLSAAPPVAAQNASEWTLQHERWYVLEIEGQPAGWVREAREKSPEHLRTSIEQKIAIARGSMKLDIEVASVFTETHAHQPVRMTSRQRLARQPIEQEWIFQAEGITQIDRPGGQEVRRELPLPEGQWLTPAAEFDFLRERRAARAAEIVYRKIAPEVGVEPMTVTSRFAGEAEFKVGDRTLPVTVWKSTTSIVPMEATEHVTSDGFVVRMELNAGFGAMVTRLATKEEALAVEGGKAPELLISTFIKPDKPIPDVLRATKAVLRLTVKNGTMPSIPSVGAQSVVMEEGQRSAVVTIDLNASSPSELTEKERKECLASSALVDSDNPQVRKLAASALKDAGDDPAAKAEKLRAFVHKYISLKGLDTAFASASETAKMRTGDCSEHAVLLCALLRAAGIPSRLATGLVYVPDFADEGAIFGWHMWTQAHLDGRWIDYDATLPVRYHAAHVLTGTTSLAESATSADLASVLSLVGNLEIQVLQVEHDKGGKR